MSKKKQDITQKAAIVKALEERGGRARLSDIYPRVIELATFKEDSDKQATIRTTMQRHPELFRHSPGKPDGWWELVSFQEEIYTRDLRIAKLEEEVERLHHLSTEDDFVRRFVEMVELLLNRDENAVKEIRKVLIALGRQDAAELLYAWMWGNEIPSTTKAIKEQTEVLKKIAERPTTQNIYGDKNEFKDDSKLLKLTLPADADPAEIAMRIAEHQKQIEEKDDNKPVKSAK